jgi:hypothetical protein
MVRILPMTQRSVLIECLSEAWWWLVYKAETCRRFSVFYEQSMYCVCLYLPLKQLCVYVSVTYFIASTAHENNVEQHRCTFCADAWSTSPSTVEVQFNLCILVCGLCTFMSVTGDIKNLRRPLRVQE